MKALVVAVPFGSQMPGQWRGRLLYRENANRINKSNFHIFACKLVVLSGVMLRKAKIPGE